MARRRFVHPDFFTDEALVTMPPFTRLLFVGLWCLADRAGRLCDKPGKIKMQLFPSDAVDVDGALGQLAAAGMVTRYAVNGDKFIQVNRFASYQHPHPGEAKSKIPAPPDVNGTRADVNGTRWDCNSAGYTEYTEYTGSSDTHKPTPPIPVTPPWDEDLPAELPDDPVTAAARWLVESYPVWFSEERFGARYHPGQLQRNYQAAKALVTTWTDRAHLEAMARVYLRSETLNRDLKHASRTLVTFEWVASGIDAQLRGAA